MTNGEGSCGTEDPFLVFIAVTNDAREKRKIGQIKRKSAVGWMDALQVYSSFKFNNRIQISRRFGRGRRITVKRDTMVIS